MSWYEVLLVFKTKFKGLTIIKVFETLIGPIKSYGLYYYDIISDFLFMITLFRNCHFKYGITSLSIMILSYLTTMIYLTVYMKQNFKKSLIYPYYHGRNLLSQTKKSILAIWHGEDLPEESDESKHFGHCVRFLESTTESVLQLCLSCLVLNEFGLSTNEYEKFNQLTSLLTSLISICLLFSKVRKQIILI